MLQCLRIHVMKVADIFIFSLLKMHKWSLNSVRCELSLSHFCRNGEKQQKNWDSGHMPAAKLMHRFILWYEVDFNWKFCHVKHLLTVKYSHTIITE